MTPYSAGGVESVVVTAALASRPINAANPRLERQALRHLAALMVDRPREVLPRFVDLAMEIGDAVAAGLSLYEFTDDGGIFRWRHLRGNLRRFEGATTPRDFSPCGVTLDCKAPTLYAFPERYYGWIADAGLTIPEVLLVPLYLGNDTPFGTLWIVADQIGHFHNGHAEALVEIAEFVSVALRLTGVAEAAPAPLQAVSERHPSRLLRKLASYESLDADDQAAIEGVSIDRRTIARGEPIAADAATTISVETGFVGECNTFSDGHRQIVRVYLPGDLLPMFKAGQLRLEALSDVELTVWPTAVLAAVGRERGAVARAFDCARIMSEATFYRWVAVLGGRSANVRMAHLLYEWYHRLLAVDLASSTGYDLPLSQQELASICGLSLVHTNKTLRQGLAAAVRFKGRRLEIDDLNMLRRLGEFDIQPDLSETPAEAALVE